MKEPVGGAESLPAVMHHPPRPDGAVGMGDGAGAAGGARGHHHIAEPAGIAHRVSGARAGFEAAQLRLGDERAGRRIGHRDARPGDDHRRSHRRDDLRDLRRREPGRRRHRHDAGGDGAEKGEREAHAIAEPQQQPVARSQAAVEQPARDPEHGIVQPRIAPPLRARGAQDHQRDPVRRPRPGVKHVAGEVERDGAGRGRAGFDDREHSPWLRFASGRCKP